MSIVHLLIVGIDYVIPLLGAFAAGFIVIFPGLCLLEVSLRRLEKQQLEIDEDHGDTTTIQSGGHADDVIIRDHKRRDWGGWALFVTALFLLVFSAFMLGIIVTNSIMNLNPKAPLCQ